MTPSERENSLTCIVWMDCDGRRHLTQPLGEAETYMNVRGLKRHGVKPLYVVRYHCKLQAIQNASVEEIGEWLSHGRIAFGLPFPVRLE